MESPRVLIFVQSLRLWISQLLFSMQRSPGELGCVASEGMNLLAGVRASRQKRKCTPPPWSSERLPPAGVAQVKTGLTTSSVLILDGSSYLRKSNQENLSPAHLAIWGLVNSGGSQVDN